MHAVYIQFVFTNKKNQETRLFANLSKVYNKVESIAMQFEVRNDMTSQCRLL